MTDLSFIGQLKEQFVKAGFIDSSLLIADIFSSPTEAPSEIIIMHNSYALMVGCAVSLEAQTTKDSLLKAKDDVQGFVRKVLLALENQKGLIVDGYLLLVLDHEPTGDVKDVIRDIELDTKVCRKHVVWPMTNQSSDELTLDRLQFITILSLPEPLFTNSSEASDFVLSPEASALLEEYKKQKNLDRLMASIKQGGIINVDRQA